MQAKNKTWKKQKIEKSEENEQLKKDEQMIWVPG